MTNPNQKLKVVSLKRNVTVIRTQKEVNIESQGTELEDEIVAPIFGYDEEDAVENIRDLIGKVYEEFSAACDELNLNWEAELEMGLEFGVKFGAKLTISPKENVTGNQ